MTDLDYMTPAQSSALWEDVMSDMFATLIYGLLLLVTIVYIVMWAEGKDPTKHSSAPLFITAIVWCFTLIIGPTMWLYHLGLLDNLEMLLPAMFLHAMLVVTTAFTFKAITASIEPLSKFIGEEDAQQQ